MSEIFSAQSNIVASGGEGIGFGGSNVYSIGQIDYITQSGDGNTISQGIQQVYEVSVVTDAEVEHNDLSILIYPNPTNDFIVLSLNSNFFEGFL